MILTIWLKGVLNEWFDQIGFAVYFGGLSKDGCAQQMDLLAVSNPYKVLI